MSETQTEVRRPPKTRVSGKTTEAEERAFNADVRPDVDRKGLINRPSSKAAADKYQRHLENANKEFILYLAFNKNRTRKEIDPETGKEYWVPVDPRERKIFPVTVKSSAISGGSQLGIIRWQAAYNSKILRVRRGEANFVTVIRCVPVGEKTDKEGRPIQHPDGYTGEEKRLDEKSALRRIAKDQTMRADVDPISAFEDIEPPTEAEVSEHKRPKVRTTGNDSDIDEVDDSAAEETSEAPGGENVKSQEEEDADA